MTDRDKDVVRAIVREELASLVATEVSKQLDTLKAELKQSLLHDLTHQVNIHSGRRMEHK